jgi:colanic acid biosynthesis glycosyl transferase WcaI
MKILIYGLYFAPELTGVGKYSGEMAAWLTVRGNDVEVITAPPHHPNWAVWPEYRSFVYRTEVTDGVRIVRCPIFVPQRPTTVSRILHFVSFAVSSFPALLARAFWRPDVIICVVPTLVSAPGALILGALTGAKTVLHVQDFEIDAMVGLDMGRRSWLVRIAFRVERWLLRRFDVISTISMSMVRGVTAKVGDAPKAILFPNWVDTSHVAESSVASSFRREWNIADSTRVILYSGNLGHKQGLEILVDAAAAFEDDPDILFVVVGNGVMRDRLVAMVAEAELENVTFYPLQPYDRLPDLLALADIHLVLQKKGAADLVMPSKLTTILAAGGHALITADQDTELGRLCVENPGIGYLCEPENRKRFIELLGKMLTNPNISSRRPNRFARAYAVRHLEKEKVLATFLADLCDE